MSFQCGKWGSCAVRLAAAVFMVASCAAQATSFTAYIREFSIEKNDSPFFTDTFDDGNPPPASPDPKPYGVNGNFVGGEAGGKLRLGGTGYVPLQSAVGRTFLVNSATLQTNNDSNDTVNGLKRNHTFVVAGLFDYAAPDVDDSYGVRLTDGSQNDVVDVRVAWSSVFNAPVVRFSRQDFVLGTSTLLEEVLLPAAYSGSIVLGLLHETADTDVIKAGFCLGDFSVCDSGGAQFLNTTTTIFHGETWTRADFRAITVAPASTVTVVEYHHAAFDHYFITPVPGEIALLDAHAPPFEQWSRTGFSFNVYPNAGAPAGSVAICRFFNDHFFPKSSHFYAAHGFGCEATIALFPDWGLEDDKLFNTMLPDAVTGACPAGTIPVYRLYNQGMGGAPNHRFVTSLAERQKMLNQGFVAEGAGIGVGMCVPA